MATPTTLPSTFVAGNVLTAAQMNALRGAFRILQVVSTTKTDTFSTTSTSLTDITGLSVSITPTSSSSKVYVVLSFGATDVSADYIRLFDVTRGGTPVGVGDAASNRTQVGIMVVGGAALRTQSHVWTYLDAPATTSAITYQARCQTSGGTLYINRSSTDTDNAFFGRAASTITAIEVSA